MSQIVEEDEDEEDEEDQEDPEVIRHASQATYRYLVVAVNSVTNRISPGQHAQIDEELKNEPNELSRNNNTIKLIRKVQR